MYLSISNWITLQRSQTVSPLSHRSEPNDILNSPESKHHFPSDWEHVRSHSQNIGSMSIFSDTSTQPRLSDPNHGLRNPHQGQQQQQGGLSRRQSISGNNAGVFWVDLPTVGRSTSIPHRLSRPESIGRGSSGGLQVVRDYRDVTDETEARQLHLTANNSPSHPAHSSEGTFLDRISARHRLEAIAPSKAAGMARGSSLPSPNTTFASSSSSEAKGLKATGSLSLDTDVNSGQCSFEVPVPRAQSSHFVYLGPFLGCPRCPLPRAPPSCSDGQHSPGGHGQIELKRIQSTSCSKISQHQKQSKPAPPQKHSIKKPQPLPTRAENASSSSITNGLLRRTTSTSEHWGASGMETPNKAEPSGGTALHFSRSQFDLLKQGKHQNGLTNALGWHRTLCTTKLQ